MPPEKRIGGVLPQAFHEDEERAEEDAARISVRIANSHGKADFPKSCDKTRPYSRIMTACEG